MYVCQNVRIEFENLEYLQILVFRLLKTVKNHHHCICNEMEYYFFKNYKKSIHKDNLENIKIVSLFSN